MKKIMKNALTVTMLLGAAGLFAQDPAAGRQAMEQAAGEIGQYFVPVRVLCFGLAAIFAIAGAVKIVAAMNSGDKDTTRLVMTWGGAALFMVIAAFVIPTFFGIQG